MEFLVDEHYLFFDLERITSPYYLGRDDGLIQRFQSASLEEVFFVTFIRKMQTVGLVSLKFSYCQRQWPSKVAIWNLNS